MSRHDQLLDQARRLATAGVGPTQQVDLRRAVSSAYYAFFHFLIAEACRYLIGVSRKDEAMRALLARAFAHGEMVKASRPFEGGTLPAAMNAHLGPVPMPLREVAQTFIWTQKMRHRADYDFTPGSNFLPEDTTDVIKRVEKAMDR